MSNEYITQQQVADILRCGIARIRKLVRSGELPAFPGPPILISQTDLRAYVDRNKVIRSKPAPLGGILGEEISPERAGEIASLAGEIWRRRNK